jgi:hypothetical protein
MQHCDQVGEAPGREDSRSRGFRRHVVLTLSVRAQIASRIFGAEINVQARERVTKIAAPWFYQQQL